TALTVPAQVGGLSATTVSATRVNLAWNDVTGESGYTVQRSSNGGASWTTIASPSANTVSYSDIAATEATDYLYRVWGSDATGNGTSSATASATTFPAAPSGLGATAASTTQIDLSWTDNSEGETGFKIERSDDGGSA